ncbi:MAG: hypothetical protein QXH20_03230 [Candidatus Bathyarchaeia archaeon]
MSFTGLRQPVTQVLRVKFDFAPNAPAGAEDIGQITSDPALGAVETLPIPSNEVWHITDIYAENSSDIGADGYLDLIVNDLRQNIRFGPMSQTLKTLLNPVRLHQAIVIDRLSRLQFIFKIRSPVGASAVSTTINVVVVRVPVA